MHNFLVKIVNHSIHERYKNLYKLISYIELDHIHSIRISTMYFNLNLYTHMD